MTDMDPSEVGLEFSLTAYDEGFEEYLELAPPTEEAEQEEEEKNHEQTSGEVSLFDEEDDESCCSFLDKPSVSKDQSHDGTVSTSTNSIDEGLQDTYTLIPHSNETSDKEKETSANKSENENKQVSWSSPPPPPPRPTSPRDPFLARLDASRAYMTTFPDT
eukprot:scaffold4046_cov187-Amphora_coffeaeformis.AAC.4